VIAARAALLAAWVTVAAFGAGCGDDQQPNVFLQLTSQWNDDPGSIDQIGYQVQVDLTWPDRGTSCAPLPPNLTLHVNDFQAVPMVDNGDCATDALISFGPFLSDVPVTVTLQGGDKTIGQAKFDELFPGMGLAVVSPAGGQVHAGDQLVLSLPSTPNDPLLLEAKFYWLDTPASVPPFYSNVYSTDFTIDGQTMSVTTPAQTGHAQLVVQDVLSDVSGEQLSCTGFQFCTSKTDTQTQGPVAIEVTP
jgi:hypothetical protein